MHATSFRYLAVAFAGATLAGCGADRSLGPDERAALAAGGSSMPSGLVANTVSPSEIDLSWQDNSVNESGFEVQRSTAGPTGSFAVLGTSGANVTSYVDAGLTAATRYCYRVRTFKTAGRKTTYSEFSAVACATTQSPPPPPPGPAAPSNASATPTYAGVVTVAWTDNSSDEQGFRIERSQTQTGPWTSIVTTSSNATSYLLGHPVEEVWCYRVLAVNANGESPSNVDCTAPPAAPLNLAATLAADGATVELAWQDASAVEDGYEVQRAGADGPYAVVANLPQNASAYHDAGLSTNATYRYLVRAKKDGGFSNFSNEASVVIASTVPVAPTDVVAVPVTSSDVVVTWQTVSTNTEGFRVERSTTAGATWDVLGTTGASQLGWGDGGRTAEQQVCYRVVALNRIGESPPSSSDCTAPAAAPTNLTATTVAGLAIDLAWTDNSSVESGYDVRQVYCYQYYYGYEYCDSYVIATLGPNATSFRHTGLNPSEIYRYYVQATTDGGGSDPSNEASAWSELPPAAPSGLTATALAPGRIDLAWTDNSSDEQYFLILRCQGSEAACVGSPYWSNVGYANANATTFSDVGAQASTTYTYQVFASRSGPLSDPSNAATATTPAP